MKLKRIDPWSAGRLMGAAYALIGVLVGVFVACASVVGVRTSDSVPFEVTGGLGAGVFALIAMPVFYGVMGFFGGIVTAAVYNLVAGWVGGIEVELSDD